MKHAISFFYERMLFFDCKNYDVALVFRRASEFTQRFNFEIFIVRYDVQSTAFQSNVLYL